VIGEPHADDPASDVPAARGFASVVSRLAAVNGLAIVAALVSGPILARALGAEGRGELAAIVVVLTIAPWLLDLGLAHWVARERAMGRPRDEILGTVLPVAFVCSLVAVVAAVPLSHVLGGDREVVVVFLQVGFFLTPIGVVLFTLSGLVVGESRWDLLAAGRIIATVAPVLVLVALSLLDGLTVASAAATLLGGVLLSSMLPLILLRGVRRLPFSLRHARTAASFGVKSWLTSISVTANIRIDQVLMAGLVSSRELGLYAVAVSIASLTSGLIMAVSHALYPRVARGDGDLTARSCRVAIAIVAAAGLVLATAASWAIPFVFGDEFRDAVTMVLILLVASVPLSAAAILASGLTAAGDPAAPMRAELAAVAVTIPALIVFLPAYGGVGAAVISFVAYGVRFGMLLRSASRRFERSLMSFVLPTRADATWLARQLRRLARRDEATG